MALKRLTDIGSATGVTLSDFIHIVITGDTSQDSAGSSYKASLQQVYDVFNISNSVFTGNTSATCITDLYVTNLNSCSPLYIQPTNVGDVLIGSGGDVNVGIGTSSPTAKLHIKGSDDFSSNSSLNIVNSANTSILLVRNDRKVEIGPTDGLDSTLSLVQKSGTNTIFHFWSTDFKQIMSASDDGVTTGYVRIGSGYGMQMDLYSQNFGVNGAPSSSKFSIKGGGSGSILSMTPAGGSGWIEFNQTANFPSIAMSDSGGTQVMSLNSGGNSYINTGFNLGIGLTTPSEKLDVVGNVNITGQIYVDIPSTHIPSGTSQTINWNDGNYQIIDLDSATGNVTLTFTNAKAGAVYSLQVIQGSVTRSLVYPGSMKWEGGTPLVPTSGNDAIDLITMVYNGTDFLASYGSAYS